MTLAGPSDEAGGLPAWVGGPPLHDLWRRAAERLERNGLRPTGRFRVPTPTRRLQRAVGDLVGREVTTSQCTVDLADLDRRLRLRAGTEGVVDAAERALGRRLTDRPAAGEEQRLQRNAVLGRARERLDASGLGSQHWVDDWLAGLQRDGLLTRHADSEGVLPGAVEALGAALTVDEVLARTELAARVLHDSHALDDGSPVARLVLRALAQRAGVTSPSSD